MKRSNVIWTTVTMAFVAGSLLWYTASAGAEDAARDEPSLPITCQPGESHVGATGYAGLAVPGETTDQAINNHLSEYDSSLTANDYEEVVDMPILAVDGTPTSTTSARVFVDESKQSAFYLAEVDGQWRVEASVTCESFIKEEK